MKRLILCLIFCFFSQLLSAKVRILTFHCNHSEFIEYQCKALQKFLLDEYELIVFNDGFNPQERQAIQRVCDRYHVKCVHYDPSCHATNPLNQQIQQALSTPLGNDFFCFPLKDGVPDIQKIHENVSVRHCHLIQYALDHFGYDHDDIVVIMDGDVFPIRTVSIRELLNDVPIAGIDSEFWDKHYLWVPLIAFDSKRLPNLKDLKFHVDLIDGVVCDTGSHSYQYLKDNPTVKYRLYPRRHDADFYPYDRATFSKLGLEPLLFAPIEWPTSMEFYVDYQFVHFRGGSGLHPNKKFRDIALLMENILQESLSRIIQ